MTDPNEILHQLDIALRRPLAEARSIIVVACTDLEIWLDRGGEAPDWSRYPAASTYFKTQHVESTTKEQP